MPHSHTHVSNLEHYIDFKVLDRDGSKVGEVEAVWEDPTGNPAFLSVRTGWLGMGRAHVVPAEEAAVNEHGHAIRLPYTRDVVKKAPSYDDQIEIDSGAASEIYDYYRGYGFKGTQSPPTADYPLEGRASETSEGDTTASTEEEQVIPLKEEQLHVGKREETAGVRLRKVIRTEVVSKPVEIEREELVVERADVDRAADQPVGEEEDVFIPLRREEVVVSKDTRVGEEVRVGKEKHTEHRDVREEVKKEDLDIDKDDTTKH
ncbi:MAG: PRC and DUF2382 domain-containing protein [Aquisalimonadaceae bacterium]